MFIHRNLLFRRPRRDAFTLIEMLVVIGVILILVGIAVPNFIGVMDRAKVTQCKTFIQELKGAVAAYNTDTRQWPKSGSEHLFAALGGYAPYSAKSSKRYNPPYMEFDTNSAGPVTYSREYSSNADLQIKQKAQSGNPRSLKEDSLRINQPEVNDWRPVLDPWRRPIVYISPDDLRLRFNDDPQRQVSLDQLIAMDIEVAVNDRNRQANTPFGMNSGQFWSAGRDGVTASGDTRPAAAVGSNDKIRGLYQPGGLSGSDSRDNDGDGVSDASDQKAKGANVLAEDDINSW